VTSLMSRDSFAVKHVITISSNWMKSKNSSIYLKLSISANKKAALYVNVNSERKITKVLEKPHIRPTFDSG